MPSVKGAAQVPGKGSLGIERPAQVPGKGSPGIERPKKTPKLLEDISLFGEITDARAGSVVKQIQLATRRGDLVRLWICSLGGDLGGALAIHDALKCAEGSEAIATGNCQSAALVAFLGAEMRWATPNTIFMNHDVTADVGHHLPDNLGLSALDWLKGLPKGTFGPAVAREFGIIATLGEVSA